MLRTTIPQYILKEQLSTKPETLTEYLKSHRCTPAERQAWNRATGPGTKAGTAPKTVAELRARLS